jgi:hypothetical protein
MLQVLVAERGPLVFVFNWHPHEDYEGLKVAAPEPGDGHSCNTLPVLHFARLHTVSRSATAAYVYAVRM